MTKHEGPMQVGDNSAGCSLESSPVDSLLDDQGELRNYWFQANVFFFIWNISDTETSDPNLIPVRKNT